MLAPKRSCLGYSKVYCDVRKNGSWHIIKTDILRITYSIFSILIPKSVLVFFTFTPISIDDTDLIWRLPFWSVPQ